MSRYNKIIKDILDGIMEGYTLDDGKLKVVNEAATKAADAALHRLVLEKSRDLWDQLEAAEDSLTDVAEEISFEELNADPSSVDMTMSVGGNEPATPEVDAAAMGAEPTLENLLGSDDFDLTSVFEVMDAQEPPPAAGHRDEPTMMEEPGDEDDVVDGDEDFSDLEVGMDDNDMGSSDMEGDEFDNGNGDEFGDPEMNGDGMDIDNGDEFGDGMDMEPEGGMDMDNGDEFDFDLDLGSEDDMDDLEGGMDDLEGGMDDLEGAPMGNGEEEETDEGYGAKPYRMEGKCKKGKK